MTSHMKKYALYFAILFEYSWLILVFVLYFRQSSPTLSAAMKPW